LLRNKIILVKSVIRVLHENRRAGKANRYFVSWFEGWIVIGNLRKAIHEIHGTFHLSKSLMDEGKGDKENK